MKTQKRTLVLLLVFALALALTACKSDSSGDLVGTWNLTGGTYFGEGIFSEDGISIDFEFKKGGSFAMTISAFGESDTTEGTWKVSGDKVTMTVNNEPLSANFKVSGKTLTMTIVDSGSDDGETLKFTKK